MVWYVVLNSLNIPTIPAFAPPNARHNNLNSLPDIAPYIPDFVLIYDLLHQPFRISLYQTLEHWGLLVLAFLLLSYSYNGGM